MYARARNQAKWACRNALRDFEKKIVKEAKLNPKAFYAYARSKLRTKEVIADLVDEFGTPVSGDADKAELFNNFFSGVFTNEDTSNMPDLANRQFDAPIDDIVFSSEVVLKKRRYLKVNKSSSCVKRVCRHDCGTLEYYFFQVILREPCTSAMEGCLHNPVIQEG